ncbi:hypothetical protein V8B97DRAFT_1875995 [Scleroderma yunnanense]
MRTLSSSLPTKRETLLVLILLACFTVLFSDVGIRESLSISFIPGMTLKQHPFDKDLDRAREPWRTHISWTSEGGLWLPQTSIVIHAPGWTIFDNLYVMNGTVFVVTDVPQTIPPRERLTSTGIEIKGDPELVAARFPTDRELRIISPEEAIRLFGSGATLIDGVTWMVNDPPQFIRHYYHWVAELLFGFWRTYSSLDLSIPDSGISALSAPHRIWFVHLDADHWRDPARLNQWVLRSAFPSLTADYSDDWIERAELGRPFLLDRVLLSDRAASMQGKHFDEAGRPLAEACLLPGSFHWWSPIARNAMQFAGLIDEPSISATSPPVITYISRQVRGGRMLVPEHHDHLVEELYALRDRYGYEVNVVTMERLSREEQIKLAARTTIMMGVHGNGMTSLVWMKPSPHTTVMEFYIPGGFTSDYQYTAYALGITYYGWWGNVSFTSDNLPRRAYPEGFHGKQIPIDGTAVAKVCLAQLQA